MAIGYRRIGGKRDGVLRVYPRAVNHLNGAEGTGVHEGQDSIWHASSTESLPVRLAVRTRTGGHCFAAVCTVMFDCKVRHPWYGSCPRDRLEKTGAAKGFTAGSANRHVRVTLAEP